MKIFGIEIKWPETKKSKIKRMLREKGSLATVNYLYEHGDICDDYCAQRFLKKEVRVQCHNANYSKKCVRIYVDSLIGEGCFDLDLYRFYKMHGKYGLGQKLISQYRFISKQIKKYILMVESYAREQEGEK